MLGNFLAGLVSQTKSMELSSSSSSSSNESGNMDRPTTEEDVMHHQKHFELPSSLQGRCQETYGWSLEFSDKALHGYRQFIKLKQVLADWGDGNVLPSPTVKKVWMMHLQYTKQYGKACERYCENMIHHDPDHEVTQHQQTKTELCLEEQQLGQVHKRVWSFEPECYGEADADICDSKSTSGDTTLYSAKSRFAAGGSYISVAQQFRFLASFFKNSEDNASDTSPNSNAVETEINFETTSARVKAQGEVYAPASGVPSNISCNDDCGSTCSSELARTPREGFAHDEQTMQSTGAGVNETNELEILPEQTVYEGIQTDEQHFMTDKKMRETFDWYQNEKQALHEELLRERKKNEELSAMNEYLKQTLQNTRDIEREAGKIQDLQRYGKENESQGKQLQEHMENKQQLVLSNQTLRRELIACQKDKKCLEDDFLREIENHGKLRVAHDALEQKTWYCQLDEGALHKQLTREIEEHTKCKNDKEVFWAQLSRCFEYEKQLESIAEETQQQLHSNQEKKTLQTRLDETSEELRQCQDENSSLGMKLFSKAADALKLIDANAALMLKLQKRTGHRDKLQAQLNREAKKRVQANETANVTSIKTSCEDQGQLGPLQPVVTQDDEVVEDEPGKTRPVPSNSDSWQKNGTSIDLPSAHSEFKDSGQDALLANRYDAEKSAGTRLVSVVSTDEDDDSTTSRTSTGASSDESGSSPVKGDSSSSNASPRTKARFTSVSPTCSDDSNLSPQQTRGGTRSSGRGARFDRGGGIVRGHGIRDKVKALIPKVLRELQDHNLSGFCDVAPQTASREWKCSSCMEVNDALATNCRNDFCNKRRPRGRHCKNIEFEVREWDWDEIVDRETILLDTPELFRRDKKHTDLPQLKRLGKDILGEARAKNRHRGPKENSAFKREIELVGKGYFKGVLSDDATKSLLDQCPSGSGFVVKSGAGEQMVAFVNLSINTCDTHVDDFVGFLLVLAGKKIVYMSQPALAKKLRDKKATHVANMENFSSNYFPEVKPFEYDAKQAAQEGWQRYELGPGDGIVIPTNWLHSIQSVNGTVGVSLKIGPAHNGLSRGGGSGVPILHCISDDFASDDEIDQETSEIVSLAGDEDGVIVLCSDGEDDAHERNEENRVVDLCSDGGPGESGSHEGSRTIDEKGVIVLCSDGEEDAEASEASEDGSIERSDGDDDCDSVDSDECSSTPEDDNSSLHNDETGLGDSEKQKEHDNCSDEEDSSDSDSQVVRGKSQISTAIVTRSREATSSGKQCRKGEKIVSRRRSSAPRGKEDSGSSADGKGNSASGRVSTTTVVPSRPSSSLLPVHRQGGETTIVTRGQESQQSQVPSQGTAAEAAEDMPSRRSRRRRTALACGLCKKVWGKNDLLMWLLLKPDGDDTYVQTQHHPHIVCFDCCSCDRSPRLPKLADDPCFYNKNSKKEYESMMAGYKPVHVRS